MVAIDAATKYIILRPSKGETGRAASELVLDIVRRFGIPQEITSDQGTAFTSELFKSTCHMLAIRHKLIAVGKPRSNGMVERANRTILDVASITCQGLGKDWSKSVGEVEYALNTRISSATKHSPYELVCGR